LLLDQPSASILKFPKKSNLRSAPARGPDTKRRDIDRFHHIDRSPNTIIPLLL